MVETEKKRLIAVNRLRNGNVIQVHREDELNGGIYPESEELWIRKRSNEGNLAERVLTVEDRGGKRFEMSVVDILYGVYKGPFGTLVIDGVFAPSKIGVVDPIMLRKAALG